MKIAIMATHPIQYQVPWFRQLAQQSDVNLKVFYSLLPDQHQQGIGFGIPFAWDVPLLEGYQWECLPSRISSPTLGRFFGRSTPHIYHALKEYHPDVVIILGWNMFPLVQAMFACLILDIPRIVRGESNGMRQRPWYVRILHRMYLRLFDAFLVIGKSNEDFYRQAGVSEKLMFPCRYFVDNIHFNSAYEILLSQKSHLRYQWRIPEDCCCFLYVGKLEPKKRIFDLLEALGLLAKQVSNIHLLVVGTGELFDEAQQRSVANGLPVSFAGFLNQTELPKAYVASDCLVLPSDYGETWGLVVNEAMACGLPAVVSDRVGCHLDLVENNVTGYTFPFSNASILAEKMAAIAADSEHRKSMGCCARMLIQNYSIKHAVEGTITALSHVLEAKAANR